MFDLAAFTFKLFQHRRKRNQDVGARTRWAGPDEGRESSSSGGQAACAHLICSLPNLSLCQTPRRDPWARGTGKCPIPEDGNRCRVSQYCPHGPGGASKILLASVSPG